MCSPQAMPEKHITAPTRVHPGLPRWLFACAALSLPPKTCFYPFRNIYGVVGLLRGGCIVGRVLGNSCDWCRASLWLADSIQGLRGLQLRRRSSVRMRQKSRSIYTFGDHAYMNHEGTPNNTQPGVFHWLWECEGLRCFMNIDDTKVDFGYM